MVVEKTFSLIQSNSSVIFERERERERERGRENNNNMFFNFIDCLRTTKPTHDKKGDH